MSLKTDFAREMCSAFDPVALEQIAAEMMNRSFWIEDEISRLRQRGVDSSSLMDYINDASWLRSTASLLRGVIEDDLDAMGDMMGRNV